MIVNRPMAGMTGVLALSLALGTGAVSAQTMKPTHPHTGFLTGTVQNLGASSFQVVTASGATPVSFTSSTRVIQMVAGGTADLVTNARVSVRLTPGTTTVTAVTVDSMGNRPTSTAAGTYKNATGTAGAKTWKSGTWTKPSGTSTAKHAQDEASGTVVSFDAGTRSLTLAGRHGTNVSYTLAGNATISKATAALTSNLRNGETVSVVAPNGAAKFITILAGS